jgi:predicted ABC-type ATPase
MEAILFAGIQGVGKSTYYAARFADSHVRINLDMLTTRHRERILLSACLQAGQPFVADNTNLTAADRARYIGPARAAGFVVVGYYFQSRVHEAIERNRSRPTPVQNGINYNDLPGWQRQGSAVFWEKYGEPSINPLTAEKVVAQRRRLGRSLELPVRAAYRRWLADLVAAS